MSGSKTHQILWDSLVPKWFSKDTGMSPGMKSHAELGHFLIQAWGIYPSQMPRFFVKKLPALRDEFLWAGGPASHKSRYALVQGPNLWRCRAPAGHHRDILNGSRIDMKKPQQNWKPPSAKTGILRELLCNTWEVGARSQKNIAKIRKCKQKKSGRRHEKLLRVLHPNGTTDISNWSLTKNLRSRVKIVKSSSLQLDSFKWKKIGFSLKPPSFPPASPSPRSDLHVLLDPEIPIPKTTAPALPRLQPHEFEVRQFLHCYPQSLSSFPPRCSSFQIDPRLLNWIFLKHWAQSSICETSKFMSSIHLSLTKNSSKISPW